MSGAGNDFVVIDNRTEEIAVDVPAFARTVCSRHFGVGADGLLVVGKSSLAEFTMHYYNADGSYGGMCGNGGRCIARYVQQKDRLGAKLLFEALGEIFEAEFTESSVILHMSEPKQLKTNILLHSDLDPFNVNFIDTGSPHAVIECSDIESVDLKKIGREFRYHQEFSPEGTNVNFVQWIGGSNLKMRTYERGVETETLACGTGAVASSVIASLHRELESPIDVLVRSGETLRVHFSKVGGEFSRIRLEGSAHFLFTGTLVYDTDSNLLLDGILSTF